jgi:hypothetical protein
MRCQVGEVSKERVHPYPSMWCILQRGHTSQGGCHLSWAMCRPSHPFSLSYVVHCGVKWRGVSHISHTCHSPSSKRCALLHWDCHPLGYILKLCFHCKELGERTYAIVLYYCNTLSRLNKEDSGGHMVDGSIVWMWMFMV